eukprot:TRINITY_DN11496_c0_g1_i1.p1 TRINITY_DN11496_c0_g1~~TRINITY_DN11496_c0_g1_i1.p1  ORF type:complete len:1168 (-),score=238.79 TRINITY_DN11496_c0_g1_i1:50-3553(-)
MEREGTMYLKVKGEEVSVDLHLAAGVLSVMLHSGINLLHTFNITPETKITGPIIIGELISLQLSGGTLAKALQFSHEEQEIIVQWIEWLNEAKASNTSARKDEDEDKILSYELSLDSPKGSPLCSHHRDGTSEKSKKSRRNSESRRDRVRVQSGKSGEELSPNKTSKYSKNSLSLQEYDSGRPMSPKNRSTRRSGALDVSSSPTLGGSNGATVGSVPCNVGTSSGPSSGVVGAFGSPTGSSGCNNGCGGSGSTTSGSISGSHGSFPGYVGLVSSCTSSDVAGQPILASLSDGDGEKFSKRDSGSRGRPPTIFKHWGPRNTASFCSPTRSQSGPRSTIPYGDYPRVKPFVFNDDLEDLEISIQSSDDDEETSTGMTRKVVPDAGVETSVVEKESLTQEESKNTNSDCEQKKDMVAFEARRSYIAKEIYTTEKSYVESLQICIDHYRSNFLMKCSAFDETIDTINSIFGNLNVLYGINKNLCVELEKIVETWSPESELGVIFVRWSPFLKMYTDYSEKYSSAVGIFTKLERKNPKFKTVVDECYLSSNINLRLTDLLIMPIQRIPRYSLLLTDLLKHTLETHKDYLPLKEALECIQNVAVLVNESVRRRENSVRLDELHKEGFDLSNFIVSSRHLIKDGIVKVKISKEQKTITESQYWILFSDIIIRCKKESAKHVNLQDHSLPLSLVWIQKDGKKESFMVLPNESLTFKDEHWHSEISSAVDNFVASSSAEVYPRLKKYLCVDSKPEGFRVSEYYDLSGCYIGQWCYGKRCGKGKWKYKGSLYSGEWKDDKPHGKGRWKYPTGGCYVGSFDLGEPHGRGMLRTRDGSCCVCSFSRGKRKGMGKITYANGDIFQGQWKNDRINGEGKLICRNGVTYTGEWESNTFHGVGKLSVPNRFVYEGNFCHGIRSGRGCYIYADDSSYVGTVEDGMRHGIGKMIFSDHSSYEGQWAYDLIDGHGKRIYEDDSIYEGNFEKGTRHGRGKIIYNRVGSYEGEWEYDRRHGEGTYLDIEGNNCSGTWVNDKLHGHAVILYANGSKFDGIMANGLKEKGRYTGCKGDSVQSYEGEWSRGMIHGKGILILGDGTTYKGSFDHGTATGDCIVTYQVGIVTHTCFVNDVKEGKVSINLYNDSVSGVMMSNTLMHATGYTMVEPSLPLWGRETEKDYFSVYRP